MFFLGGQDLEMQTIRELLEQHASGRFFDHGLRWGACASAYRAEIEAALARKEMPVLVELENDLDRVGDGPTSREVAEAAAGSGAKAVGGLLVVDHHGPRAGKDQATALEQVFALLGLPASAWTRHFELVAANDRAHIRGLLAASASVEEIASIRALDRRAQGVTGDDERKAVEAIARRKSFAEGRLTVLRLGTNRTSAVADRMESALGGPGYANLLCLCPDEADFFGDGGLVLALHERFAGGWYGGDLPQRGYWGRTPAPPEGPLIDFLIEQLEASVGQGD